MPRTSAIVHSCSPPTPTASQYGSSQNGVNGVNGVNARPSAGTPSLQQMAAAGQLPTPVARDHKGRGRGNQLPDMLPTPTSTEFKRSNEDAERTNVRGGRRLSSSAAMMPTPTARPNNNRQSRGHPLPTPIAQSGRQVGSRNNTKSGRTLLEVAMLPTPMASDFQSRGPTFMRGNETLWGAVTRRSLPTPRASDATKGSRSIPERDGKEGVTLPEEINRLRELGVLPTPTTRDWNASGTAANWTPDSQRHAGATLTAAAVRGLTTPSKQSGPSLTPGESTGTGAARLAPSFVSWMMGLPEGWETTLPMPISSTSSETGSWLTPRRARSRSSGSDSTVQLSLIDLLTPPIERISDDDV